jgi:HKD family nuclease
MFVEQLDKGFISNWLKSANDIIQIYSPWISSFGTELLFETYKIKKDIKIELYFRFDKLDIAQGLIDLQGLNDLKREGCNLHFFDSQDLHAKLYIIDKYKVLYGSCNLTEKAFSSNYEFAAVSDYSIEFDNIIKKWSFHQINQIEINNMLLEISKLTKEISDQNSKIENFVNTNTKFQLYNTGLR